MAAGARDTLNLLTSTGSLSPWIFDGPPLKWQSPLQCLLGFHGAVSRLRVGHQGVPISACAAAVTSATARLKAGSLASEGLLQPLTLRTNCSAAARTSASVAGGLEVEQGLDVAAHTDLHRHRQFRADDLAAWCEAEVLAAPSPAIRAPCISRLSARPGHRQGDADWPASTGGGSSSRRRQQPDRRRGCAGKARDPWAAWCVRCADDRRANWGRQTHPISKNNAIRSTRRPT